MTISFGEKYGFFTKKKEYIFIFKEK